MVDLRVSFRLLERFDSGRLHGFDEGQCLGPSAPRYPVTALRNVSRTTASALAADGDGSGTVDQADYGIWKTNFGQSIPGVGSTTAGVPEPASGLLFVLAGVGGFLSRRR